MKHTIKSVRVVNVPEYPHTHAFDEVAEAFSEALQVPLYGVVRNGKNIYPLWISSHDQSIYSPNLVFGAHLTRHVSLYDDDIIFQTEQVYLENPWFTPDYIELLKTHQVWDYSPLNVQCLCELYGVEARVVPIRYMPSMTKFESRSEEEKDIDVLFYGSMTPHRDEVINRLLNAGIEVYRAFNVYGKERDDLIARSKIVLNLHQHESGIFEIFRCAHLFANRKCVVSEYGSDDALDKMYDRCACFTVSLENVLKTLLYRDAGLEHREGIARRALEDFSFKTLVEELKGINA